MFGSNSVTKLTLAGKLTLHSLTCLAPKNPNGGGQNSNTESAKYVIQNGKWTCSYIAHFYSTRGPSFAHSHPYIYAVFYISAFCQTFTFRLMELVCIMNVTTKVDDMPGAQ